MDFDRFYFVLDGHKVRATRDMLEWARMFEDHAARTVAKSEIGGVEVSTVFLGLDHNFSGDGPPKLFETMIFQSKSDELDGWCQRCSTWEQAEQQHDAACLVVRATLAADIRIPTDDL